MNIPYSPPGDTVINQQKLVNEALAYAEKNIQNYQILQDAASRGDLTYKHCFNISTSFNLQAKVVEAKDPTGKMIPTTKIEVLYAVGFNFHSKIISFIYTCNSLDGQQTLTQTQ